MPGLFGMLTLGSRSLGVQSAAIEVAGNNIANAATEGYHRQSLSVRPGQVVAGFGQGSMIGGVRRAYNQFTENQLLLQTSTSSHYRLRSDVLGVLNGLFNESSSQGLSGALDGFYAALSDLGTFPESGSVRTTVLGAADAVARRFNDLSRGITDLAADLDTQIAADVKRVNELTAQIGALNKQIAQATGRGEAAGNLLDQRAQVLGELNTLVNTRVNQEADGQLTVTIGGTAVVQDGVVHSLMTAKDSSNDDHLMVLVEGSSGDMRELTGAMDSGTLGAAVELRDVTLDAYKDELDAMAWDFASRMNEVHAAGYGLDGVNGRDLFLLPGAVAGAASGIRLSSDVAGNPSALAAAADPTRVPGDSDNALALYATGTERRATLGDRTFHDYFAHLASEVGSDSRVADSQRTYEEGQLFEIQALNDSQTGVNLDEEATELQKFEAAYQASARFVTTVNEMLDVLLRM